MKPTCNFRGTPIFIIVMLVLAQLACGSSTVQQLASAIAPTTTSRQVRGSTPKPTQIPPTALPKPDPVNIIAQGFGQNDQELGFAFIVENPNQSVAVENSQYQIAAYDANNTVVETDSGYIEVMLPGQKLGLGGIMYLNEGITVAKVEAQLIAGDPNATALTTTFTVDKVVYRPNDFLSKAMGIITSPYDRDLTDLRVSAVAYNEAGEIIGGGSTYLNFILAKSTTGVDVSVISAGQVARVELYPTLSGLSMLTSDDQLPGGAQDLMLAKHGYGQDGTKIGYGMLIQNPNGGFAVEGSMYRITLYAEDGNVITSEDGYIDTLLPNQTLGVGGDSYLPEGLTVANAIFQIKSGQFETSGPIQPFSVENAKYLADPYFPKITGVIVSPYAKDITNLRVNAIAYNEAGDIIGGGYTFLDFVPANSKAAVDVSFTCAGTPAKIELYATVSALSDIR